jgi:hypothetical protein
LSNLLLKYMPACMVNIVRVFQHLWGPIYSYRMW